MKPTMQLRFKRKRRGYKSIVLLEQMWTDDTQKVREWREVPMLEDEPEEHDENWGNR